MRYSVRLGELMSVYTLRSKILTATATGCVSKGWYQHNETGTPVLVKGNSYCARRYTDELHNRRHVGYEPYSEVIASIVAKYLGIPHVTYWLDDAKLFPAIKTYHCPHVSLCTAVVKSKKFQTLSAFDTLTTFLGTTNFDPWLAYRKLPIDPTDLCSMLLFDAVIGNMDRHLNNWELEWRINEQGNVILRSALLYDHGGSLLALVPSSELRTNFQIGQDSSKPFKETHFKQMCLIKRCYPEFHVNYNIDLLWQGIDTEIQPVLMLLSKERATCVRKYLHNRLYYYLTMFGGFSCGNNEWR